MKLIPQEIAALIEQAIRDALAADDLPEFIIPAIDVRPPRNADQGDYASAVALQLAKPARLNPFRIATQIYNRLKPLPFIGAVEVVHPGYINFRLSEDWLKQQVETIIAEGSRLFQLEIGTGLRAQVEFVSANPTAPLHVGRSRGAIVGDTVARLLEAVGYSVEREYYFNNAGAQMRNLGNSLRVRYLQALGQPVDDPGEAKWFYQGEYLIEMAQALAAEKGDSWASEDWPTFKQYAEDRMFVMIKKTLDRVNIHHDVFFNENSLYESGAVWETLAELEKRGYTYKAAIREDADEDERDEAGGKGEAVWFRSTQLGDEKDRVLVKSSGEPTYTLPDIAYHANKIRRGFDLLVNVLGADHGTQYRVVQIGVNALGLDASKIHVIIVQLVRTVRGGETVRMSSRKGDFDTLDDLIDQTSPDVVRYMLLDRSTNTHLSFDLDLAVRQSNENPVYYIQNAYVRCAGIFREAAARGLSDDGADLSLLGSDELRFIRKIMEMGEQIELAAVNLEPHRIAFYALELASTFHPIYDNVRALHGDVPPELAKARLRFYRAAQVAFKRVLDLMGMSAPEQM